MRKKPFPMRSSRFHRRMKPFVCSQVRDSQRSTIFSAIEVLSRMQGQLERTLARLQVPRTPTATLDCLKRQCSTGPAAKTAVQARIKSNLRNYTQPIFNKVKQSTEGYQLSVKDEIFLLGLALT